VGKGEVGGDGRSGRGSFLGRQGREGEGVLATTERNENASNWGSREGEGAAVKQKRREVPRGGGGRGIPPGGCDGSKGRGSQEMLEGHTTVGSEITTKTKICKMGIV